MVKADEESEAGEMPNEQMLTEMGNFNEELVKAGVMLAGEGLHPSSKGHRVRFSGKERTVVDGPFAETKELVAGYWLWEVKSMDEAIEWVKRCPNPMEGESDDRDPPGVRGRGLRRRAHARGARAECAPARSDRGAGMSKLIVSEFVSLNGVIEAPGGEHGHPHSGWTFKSHYGEDHYQYKQDEIEEAESLLLGRKTYEGFSGAWPEREGPFADKMNSMPKYVVSSTLTDPEWNNTTVLSGESWRRWPEAEGGAGTARSW